MMQRIGEVLVTPSLETLEVYYGELTPSRAVIHARVRIGAAQGDLSLSASLRGPRCSQGSTLPATNRLVPRECCLLKQGRLESLYEVTAQGLVTEPVFWSPDWPALYDLTVELRRGSEVLDQTTRSFGFRPLSVVGKSLIYGGKTWVLRGVQRTIRLASAIDECRQQAAALVAPIELVRQSMLRDASDKGVLTVVLLTGWDEEEHVQMLSSFAAVGVVVLPPQSPPLGFALPGNLLLAHHVKQGDEEPPRDDARLILGEVRDPATFASWAATMNRAVIAYRELWDRADVAAARAACDQLQRDLAPYGQFAGYIV